jgi:protein involved in polysaccharide export with SLBB domain
VLEFMRVSERSRCLTARLTMVAIVSVVFSACGGSRPQNESFGPSITASADAPLKAGDILQVTFSREPDLNGRYTIDETGSVSLPLLGDMFVIDRPAADIKATVGREYEARTRNQAVQVVYLRRIRVLGEVRNPGIYHADPTMTLDDIVALAGGSETDGNLTNVSLVRDGEEVASGIDLRQGSGVAVQSGDQIFVPKTSWFSRNAAVLIGATISAIGVILAFSN